MIPGRQVRNLVNEVLEQEKSGLRQGCPSSSHHFDLVNIDYTLEPTSVKKPMEKKYKLFKKGYVDLATESATEDVGVEPSARARGSASGGRRRLSERRILRARRGSDA